jgi:hypothetical protein
MTAMASSLHRTKRRKIKEGNMRGMRAVSLFMATIRTLV